MWLLSLSIAAGSVPTTRVLPDNLIQGVVVVEADPTDLRSLLGDPVRLSQLGNSGTTVDVTKQENGCTWADYVSPSVMGKITYSVKQCATATGYETSLVESNAFKTYAARWIMTPHKEDANRFVITYEMQLSSNWIVPQSLINSTTRTAINKQLRSLAAHLDSDS